MGYFCMRKLGRFQNPVMSFCQPRLYVTIPLYVRFPEPWLGPPGVSIGPVVCLERGACEKGRKPVRNMTIYNIKINALIWASVCRQCSKIKTVSCPPIKVNIFATANKSALINL